MKTCLSVLLIFSFSLAFSQSESSINSHETLEELTDYKNTIRWNLTPYFLLGKKSINIGYERKLGDYRTASINIGYLDLPDIKAMTDSIFINGKNQSKSGFTIFADYKFYLGNRNKRKAPEGIYIGPYFGYIRADMEFDGNFYEFDNNSNPISIMAFDSQIKLNNLNLGFQIGYQFVIKDRFTIDFIFVGPASSIYWGDLKLKLDAVDKEYAQELLNNLKDQYASKIPWLDNEIELNDMNSYNYVKFTESWYNFRYVIQIGYRF